MTIVQRKRTSINSGDLRISIDFNEIQSKTNTGFVKMISQCISDRRPCTFFQLKEGEEFISVYLATGFYSVKHDHTFHQNIHYFKYSKKDGFTWNGEFDTHFLKMFHSIGITVED